MEFLHSNKDVFTWSSNDLGGVSRDISEHKLDIDPKIRPKKQKLRKLAEDRVQATKAKVQRLLDARVIREVQFITWLANIVMVRKKNGNGECALISQISIKHVQKTTFHFQELIH